MGSHDPSLQFSQLKRQEHANQLRDLIGNGPLVSVVVRTQGTRNELLAEALDSIESQIETSFEIILCLHKEVISSDPIASLIESLSEAIRSKLIRINVEGGTRAKPLNAALEIATGQFICFLDDDDLLIPNHFKTLKIAALNYPYPLILQTFGDRRYVKVYDSKVTFPYEVIRQEPYYHKPFRFVDQLTENHVPICNFFVSMALINLYSVRFDDQTEVLEDWQFLMRANRFAAVSTVCETTTIINLRDNGTNTISDPLRLDEFERTRRRIQAEICADSWIIKPDELNTVMEFVVQTEQARKEATRISELRARWTLSRVLKAILRRLRFGY